MEEEEQVASLSLESSGYTRDMLGNMVLITSPNPKRTEKGASVSVIATDIEIETDMTQNMTHTETNTTNITTSMENIGRRAVDTKSEEEGEGEGEEYAQELAAKKEEISVLEKAVDELLEQSVMPSAAPSAGVYGISDGANPSSELETRQRVFSSVSDACSVDSDHNQKDEKEKKEKIDKLDKIDKTNKIKDAAVPAPAAVQHLLHLETDYQTRCRECKNRLKELKKMIEFAASMGKVYVKWISSEYANMRIWELEGLCEYTVNIQ